MVFTKKRRKANLTQPSLERLLEKVPSKYELVLLASRRARQIKREIDFRPERARDFEFTKPLTTALFEIVEGKVTAEDLKYVDLLEESDRVAEPGFVPIEVASRRFFDDEEHDIMLDADEYDPDLDEIDEPDDINGLTEE
jgi:DNA-directed RNA polymerase omega subunit